MAVVLTNRGIGIGLSILVKAAAIVCTATIFIAAATADWNPRRPLYIIVPYPAGDGADLNARAIAKTAEGRIAVPVVVVNKPGAGVLELSRPQKPSLTVIPSC